MQNLNKMCSLLIKKVFNVTLNQLLWMVLFVILITMWTLSRKTASNPNPVIVWWTSGFPDTSETRHCPNNINCDIFNIITVSDKENVEAYMFYGSNINFDDLPLPRQSSEIIWSLHHEESPRNVEELLHEQVLNLFNFSSTFSRYSNIPYPLQYIESLEDITSNQYFVQTPIKNSFLNEIAPVMYLQSDCETATERDEYVKELMKVVKVDSYGACLNNKKLPIEFVKNYLNNLNNEEFLKFISRYKFVVAIENGVCNDYITEKLWRAIKVGTVPIYFGSPTIKDWLPNNKSAILLEDFPTVEVLSKHIDKLMANDDLYEEYLEHKVKSTITNEKLVEELKVRPYQTDPSETYEKFECFICQKLHEKRKSDLGINIVDKSHYDCPKPISALTLSVNPVNSWVYSWESAKIRAENIFNKVFKEK